MMGFNNTMWISLLYLDPDFLFLILLALLLYHLSNNISLYQLLANHNYYQLLDPVRNLIIDNTPAVTLIMMTINF